MSLTSSAYFTSVFQRAPNLSVTQWETACTVNKFSLHAHVFMEVFVKGLNSFIERQCRVPRGSHPLLCVASPDHHLQAPHPLISVYDKNCNFRKPGKTKLMFFPDERSPS